MFERRESNVRSYCRSFPATFARAKGAVVYDADGRPYLDFLAGAGALNYGHNHDYLKAALLAYLADDGVAHGLDLHTSAKAAFLEAFERRILEPRGLDHKVQFTGPTGANAVEAALKVARKATGRTGVFAFMGGFHGHSLGALAATSNREHRAAAGVPLDHVTFLPFPHGPMDRIDTLAYLEAVLDDSHSGVALPAAVLVETIQAEGGVVVAPDGWLQGLRSICDRYGIVMIVDDIQTGCGRTGPFFSFETAAIVPDIVTLSKSISGYGLPMSVVLLLPELDVWEPAEHTGTFRGNQLAFVTATAALDVFETEGLEACTDANGVVVADFLQAEVCPLDARIGVRGRGLIWGVDLAALDETGALARKVSERCFATGMLVECVGRRDTVLKLLPPLTIGRAQLLEGLGILAAALGELVPTADRQPARCHE
ncbi:MAG: diaminobutyrate--2-oxoglutarate transaminase [Acidimicrobiales bacterium]